MAASPAPPPPSTSPQAGVAVDLVEIKPDVAALGSGITLQGNALRELQGPRRLGPGAGGRLRVRHDRHPGAGPGRHRRRRDRGRQDRRPGPAGRHGHAAAGAGPDPDRPGHRGGRQGPLRHHVHRAAPRTTTASTSPSPTARPAALRPRRRRRRRPVLDPPRARHRPGDQVGRHGHLARVRPAPGERHPHRPLLRRPVLHRRLLPHRRGLASTPTSSRTRRTAARSPPRSSWPR